MELSFLCLRLKRFDAPDKVNKGLFEAPILHLQNFLRFGGVNAINTASGIPVLCKSSMELRGNLGCTFWVR